MPCALDERAKASGIPDQLLLCTACRCGALRFLVSGEGTITTRGAVVDGRLVPASFVLSTTRDKEKDAAKMTKQLERAITNMGGLYGDLSGILGPSLPQIAHLELAAIPDDVEPPLLEPIGVAADDSPF